MRRRERCEMFMLLASPLPALSLPLPRSASHSFTLPYILIPTEEYTLALQTLSASILSLLISSPPCSFCPLCHKGQHDQPSMTLLIEACVSRCFAAAVWIAAKMCHWPEKPISPLGRESKWRKDRYKKRRRGCHWGRLFFFPLQLV